MSPARFRWGVLFIIVGVILLLNNIGKLDWWVWTEILSLWPLILIAIGLEKIFTKSKAEFLSYIPIVALAAVIFFVAFNGLEGDDEYVSRRGSSYRYTVDMESGINRIEAKFDFEDTDVILNNTGSRLFRAKSDAWRMVPKVEFDRVGDVAQLEITPKRKRVPDWIRIDRWGSSGDWDVYLNDKVPVSLECLGDKSDMTLDCRDLILEDLLVNSEQGDIRIKIGALSDIVKVKLEGDEADYRITLPAVCAVKITGAGDDITGYLGREGLVESGGFYITDGYDSVLPKVEFDLSPDLSQFSIDYQ